MSQAQQLEQRLQEFEKEFQDIATDFGITPDQLKTNLFDGITAKDYINFKLNVGLEPLQIMGYQGQGKSSLAGVLLTKCFKKRKPDAFWLIAGDRNMEWRHFLLYDKIIKKITLIMPDDVKFKFVRGTEDWEKDFQIDDLLNKKKYPVDFDFYYADYSTMNVMELQNQYGEDLITQDTRKEIFVIYDAHYFDDQIHHKINLWHKLALQLLDRNKLMMQGIRLLFHEAGIMFEEGASGEHWHGVRNFARAKVEFRKNYIGPIYLSQLPTEIDSRIRKKCIWKAYKKGTAEKEAASQVKRAVKFAARNEFVMSYGGNFVLNNTFDALAEVPEIWKMKPLSKPSKFPINTEKAENNNLYRDTIIYIDLKTSKTSQKAVAERHGVSQQRISQIKHKFDDEILDYTNKLKSMPA